MGAVIDNALTMVPFRGAVRPSATFVAAYAPHPTQNGNTPRRAKSKRNYLRSKRGLFRRINFRVVKEAFPNNGERSNRIEITVKQDTIDKIVHDNF
jgi:hypothetical protein